MFDNMNTYMTDSILTEKLLHSTYKKQTIVFYLCSVLAKSSTIMITNIITVFTLLLTQYCTTYKSYIAATHYSRWENLVAPQYIRT